MFGGKTVFLMTENARFSDIRQFFIHIAAGLKKKRDISPVSDKIKIMTAAHS